MIQDSADGPDPTTKPAFGPHYGMAAMFNDCFSGRFTIKFISWSFPNQ